MTATEYLKKKLEEAYAALVSFEETPIEEISLSYKGVEPLLGKSLLHAYHDQHGVYFLSFYKNMSVTLCSAYSNGDIKKELEKGQNYIAGLKDAIDRVEKAIEWLHSEVFLDENYVQNSIADFNSEEDTYIDYTTSSINLFGWWERNIEEFMTEGYLWLTGSQGPGVKIFNHMQSANYGIWHLIKRLHNVFYSQYLLESKPNIKMLTTEYAGSYTHMVSGKKGGVDIAPVVWHNFNILHKNRRVWIRVKDGRNFVITMTDFPIVIKDDMWKEFKVTKEGVDIKSVTPTENDLDRLVARKKGCHYFYTGSI